MTTKILIIGSSSEIRTSLTDLFTKKGYITEEISDLTQGIQRAKSSSFSSIIADFDAPDIDSVDYLAQLQNATPQTPIIVLSSQTSVSTAVETMQHGAQHIIQKPILLKEVDDALTKALSQVEKKQSEQELVHYLSFEMIFEVPGSIGQIESVIDHIAEETLQRQIISIKEDAAFRAALRCALNNAVIHGNQTDETKKVKVHYLARQSDCCEITVTDEGMGFDPGKYINPADLSSAAEKNPNGLFQIYCFMDEVQFNRKGNQIRMVKMKKLNP